MSSTVINKYFCSQCSKVFDTDQDRYEHIKKVHIKDNIKSDGDLKKSGANDGSSNSFYFIPDWVIDLDDLAEYLELKPDESNILKTLWSNLGQRHDGTSPKREANKCLHYANRRLKRINKND